MSCLIWDMGPNDEAERAAWIKQHGGDYGAVQLRMSDPIYAAESLDRDGDRYKKAPPAGARLKFFSFGDGTQHG